MLKKIPVADVRLGMYIQRLEGAWLDHPFWKTQFVLSDAADLARLQSSAVTECWIDDELGRGEPGEPRLAPSPPFPAPVSADPPGPPAAVSMDDEIGRAAAICRQGRRAMQAMFGEARMGQALDAARCLPLVEDIADSVFRHPGALISLARLKTADDYSYMHSMAVCALMVALARRLGQDDAACRDAGLAGLLHDLGKAVMPLEVLNKPGRLTEAEFAVMKTHPVRGRAMLLEARGASAAAMEVCLHHHERPDGRGYPHALAGDAVSELARMGAVCDVYDAITSNRPYKNGWDPAESIAAMASWQGQFDPRIFNVFVRSLGIYPTGSLVRLSSGRLAVVLSQNASSLLTPVVKVFFSTKSRMPVPTQRLDLAAAGCNERITGRESAAQWGFKQLDELWLDGDVFRRSR